MIGPHREYRDQGTNPRSKVSRARIPNGPRLSRDASRDIQGSNSLWNFDDGFKGEHSSISLIREQKNSRMFTRIPVFAAVLSALSSTVVAVPAARSSVPEVIPGPGLPSLASLNLTSADLYAMGPPPALGKYVTPLMRPDTHCIVASCEVSRLHPRMPDIQHWGGQRRDRMLQLPRQYR